jgi:acyl carrier protein
MRHIRRWSAESRDQLAADLTGTRVGRTARRERGAGFVFSGGGRLTVNVETQMDRESVYQDLVATIREMTDDWELDFEGDIGPETRIVADLAFESIDVVQLIVMLEERYQRKELPFEELLMEDGRYVDDVKIADVVDFLTTHLRR